MRILVVNAGSSSLKLRLLDGDDALLADVELPATAAGFDDGAAEASGCEHRARPPLARRAAQEEAKERRVRWQGQ